VLVALALQELALLVLSHLLAALLDDTTHVFPSSADICHLPRPADFSAIPAILRTELPSQNGRADG
jgi:hypothetical protein